MTLHETLLAARALLQTCTPLNTDCGRFCGGACCQGDAQKGMLLFPGEEVFYKGNPRYTITPLAQTLGTHHPLLFVCNGTCNRDERPLACRIFPLLWALNEGELSLRIDPRARSVCPLSSSGVCGLSQSFVTAAQKACILLLQNPDCAAYMHSLHREFTL